MWLSSRRLGTLRESKALAGEIPSLEIAFDRPIQVELPLFDELHDPWEAIHLLSDAVANTVSPSILSAVAESTRP